MLQRCYGNVAEMLVMLKLSYSDPTEMLLCYRDVTVLQRCYGNVAEMLQ